MGWVGGGCGLSDPEHPGREGLDGRKLVSDAFLKICCLRNIVLRMRINDARGGGGRLNCDSILKGLSQCQNKPYIVKT